MTFQEKHAGQTLPSYGKKSGEEKLIIDEPDEAGIIPVYTQGGIFPVTKHEAWGVIGQIASVMQTRRPGVMVNENNGKDQ